MYFSCFGMMPLISYTPPGPVAKAFIKSDAFVCAIKGPIGSGKSTAAVMKLVRNVQKQQRDPDDGPNQGWIMRRTAIIRNTYPELKTTTIKTWHQWLPANLGNYRDSGPPTHHIIDNNNKTNWEVIFVALDRPDDVRKLLSMELSDAWINEAREVPKAILEGLTGRVGRFPPTRRDNNGTIRYSCTDAQILLDTNPPDTDHWWYRMAEDPSAEDVENTANLEDELRSIGALKAGQPLYEWFSQPGANEAGAENLPNLPPGYYLKAMANKSVEWIKVYINGQYGFVLDGKPVYPDYRDNIHCREFTANSRFGLHVGFDWGLTPAAVFAQLMPNGQWRKHSEVVTENMGIPRFAEQVKRHMANLYPGWAIVNMTGDPAGDTRNDDEKTTFDLMRAGGFEVQKASTNDPLLRITSVAEPMRRMIDGEPGMLIHPQCRTLRKAYAGGYHYKRIAISGKEMYRDVPDKDMYSHVSDADQYLMLGGGEGRVVTKRERPLNRPVYAVSDYDII